MGFVEVNEAVASYFRSGMTSGNLEPVNSVFAYPPVLTQTGMFYDQYSPGTGVGAALYIWLKDSSDKRLASGGATSGVKRALYNCYLITRLQVVVSKDKGGEAGYQNHLLLDNIKNWLLASRTLDDPSAVFQAGEGDMFGAEDIIVQSSLPLVVAGGRLEVASSLKFKIVELENA